MNLSPRQQIHQYYEDWFTINDLYERWAKSKGLTFNALFTLHAIYTFPPCTQRKICQVMMLPKQTVNTILDGFRKKGYLELEVSQLDKRSKIVSFTPTGKDYATALLQELEEMEMEALKRMPPAMVTAKLEGDRSFVRCLAQVLEDAENQ